MSKPQRTSILTQVDDALARATNPMATGGFSFVTLRADLLRALRGMVRPTAQGAIYVSSRARHKAAWRTLRAEGYRIDATWLDAPDNKTNIDWAGLWQHCTDEASRSQILLLYAEAEDMSLRGAFLEVGAALSHGVRVLFAGHTAILGDLVHDPRITYAGSTMREGLDTATSLLRTQRPEPTVTPRDLVTYMEQHLNPRQNKVLDEEETAALLASLREVADGS